MLFWSFVFLITLQRYEFYVTPHFKTTLNSTLSTLNENEIPRFARNDRVIAGIEVNRGVVGGAPRRPKPIFFYYNLLSFRTPLGVRNLINSTLSTLNRSEEPH